MTTIDPSVVGAVVGTAEALGVDPNLALADAYVESGLDPTAVGDQGTSFGLFQLHRGGELGSLTPAQAFDPATNAGVALSEFAAVQRSSPGASPGQIAALAERPADPTTYASHVQGVYDALSQAGQPPAPSAGGLTVVPVSSDGNSWWDKAKKILAGGFGPAAAGGIPGDISNAVPSLLKSLFSGWGSIALRLVFVFGALGLVVLGVQRLFPGVTRTIVTAAGSAGTTAALAA